LSVIIAIRKGHFKSDCWALGGGAEGKRLKK
jgi:hypothetical protein